MLEPLQTILDEHWKPVSRPALAAWLIFYGAFLVYAFSAHGGFLFIDNANLGVHEGGHNLFGWFGPTLGLWGGTLLQWLVAFQRTGGGGIRLLPVFLFRELALHRDLYGRCPGAGVAAGHDRRSGFRGA